LLGSRSPRSLLLVLAVACLSAGRTGASWPPPESYRLPFTIEEAAALTVAPWEFVFEASVLSSEPIMLSQPHSCSWVTEMWLRPTKQIWGKISDGSLRAQTLYVREDSLPKVDCGVMHDSAENPPPEAGDEGIFLLSYHTEGFFDRVPALFSTRCGFLPRQSDGSVRVCLLGLTYSFPYDDFVSALRRRVDLISIENSSKEADTIVIGRLAAVGSWQVETTNAVTRAGLALTVDKVIRGKIGRNTTLLLPVATVASDAHTVAQDILARWLAEWMKKLSSKDVLVFARNEGDSLVPVGIGLLEVSGPEVCLKEQRFERRKVDRIRRSLTEMRTILEDAKRSDH
jgi:hypothetical protein